MKTTKVTQLGAWAQINEACYDQPINQLHKETRWYKMYPIFGDNIA